MYVDIFKTNGGILVQSANDLRRCDPAGYDVLPVFFEFVVDVERDHQRTEDAEEDEEVVHA